MQEPFFIGNLPKWNVPTYNTRQLNQKQTDQ